MLFYLYDSMFSPVQHYNQSERDRSKILQRFREFVLVFFDNFCTRIYNKHFVISGIGSGW